VTHHPQCCSPSRVHGMSLPLQQHLSDMVAVEWLTKIYTVTMIHPCLSLTCSVSSLSSYIIGFTLLT
jgi:hypothetical protein